MNNQKGLVQRIERMLEDGVGDAFARVFGGSVVPQELEALLRREASDGVQALAGGRSLVPNQYVITLSVSDFQKLSADRDLTTEAFAKHLEEYLQEQGWQTYGEVVVRLDRSESLHTGQYRARAVVNPDVAAPQDPRLSAPAPRPAELTHAYTAEPGAPAMTDNPYDQGGYPPPPAPPAAEYDYGQQGGGQQGGGQQGGGQQGGGQPAPGGYGAYPPPAGPGEYAAAAQAVTLQLDDGSGRTYQLREGANVIGRGQDAQFRLPDTGVSRRHLEIRWDGQVALLSDLNSTNGTTVNNAPVQEWQLADGDVIRVGHSEIIVRVH